MDVQTGSGKTHSIVGPRIGQAEGESAADVAAVTPEDGVLSRAFAYAFAAMQGPDDVVEYSASLSCSEIYNDQVPPPSSLSSLALGRRERRGEWMCVGYWKVEAQARYVSCCQVSDLFRRGQQLQNLPIRYDKAQGEWLCLSMH
jgi:hypothetical protein